MSRQRLETFGLTEEEKAGRFYKMLMIMGRHMVGGYGISKAAGCKILEEICNDVDSFPSYEAKSTAPGPRFKGESTVSEMYMLRCLRTQGGGKNGPGKKKYFPPANFLDGVVTKRRWVWTCDKAGIEDSKTLRDLRIFQEWATAWGTPVYDGFVCARSSLFQSNSQSRADAVDDFTEWNEKNLKASVKQVVQRCGTAESRVAVLESQLVATKKQLADSKKEQAVSKDILRWAVGVSSGKNEALANYGAATECCSRLAGFQESDLTLAPKQSGGNYEGKTHDRGLAPKNSDKTRGDRKTDQKCLRSVANVMKCRDLAAIKALDDEFTSHAGMKWRCITMGYDHVTISGAKLLNCKINVAATLLYDDLPPWHLAASTISDCIVDISSDAIGLSRDLLSIFEWLGMHGISAPAAESLQSLWEGGDIPGTRLYFQSEESATVIPLLGDSASTNNAQEGNISASLNHAVIWQRCMMHQCHIIAGKLAGLAGGLFKELLVSIPGYGADTWVDEIAKMGNVNADLVEDGEDDYEGVPDFSKTWSHLWRAMIRQLIRFGWKVNDFIETRWMSLFHSIKSTVSKKDAARSAILASDGQGIKAQRVRELAGNQEKWDAFWRIASSLHDSLAHVAAVFGCIQGWTARPISGSLKNGCELFRDLGKIGVGGLYEESRVDVISGHLGQMQFHSEDLARAGDRPGELLQRTGYEELKRRVHAEFIRWPMVGHEILCGDDKGVWMRDRMIKAEADQTLDPFFEIILKFFPSIRDSGETTPNDIFPEQAITLITSFFAVFSCNNQPCESVNGSTRSAWITKNKSKRISVGVLSDMARRTQTTLPLLSGFLKYKNEEPRSLGACWGAIVMTCPKNHRQLEMDSARGKGKPLLAILDGSADGEIVRANFHGGPRAQSDRGALQNFWSNFEYRNEVFPEPGALRTDPVLRNCVHSIDPYQLSIKVVHRTSNRSASHVLWPKTKKKIHMSLSDVRMAVLNHIRRKVLDENVLPTESPVSIDESNRADNLLLEMKIQVANMILASRDEAAANPPELQNEDESPDSEEVAPMPIEDANTDSDGGEEKISDDDLLEGSE